MGDNIVVVPALVVGVSEEEADMLEDKGVLTVFTSGLTIRQEKKNGLLAGLELCELGFPDEYSGSFKLETIEPVRKAVKEALAEAGIDREPKLRLLQFMG